ncbi:cell cycle control protein 50A-like [Antennarius striatus]|uniref:cell cycle control protein 50A-like n=1 Tax=Antennarius striatus TaxID=241820 RepID=UPI0035B3ECAA
MATSYTPKDEDGHVTLTGPGTGPPRSRKPDNTAFKQQRLPAWKPILTAGTVTPAFFIIGLIFIPVGIGLFVTSNNIREIEVDYTGVDPSSSCFSCSQNLSWNSSSPCSCSVPFYLDQPYEGSVFMYYGLTNFYQNHRRYVKSRDDRQLNGDPGALKSPSQDCEPFAFRDDKPVAPCGAVANSMFNDTLELFHIAPSGASVRIPLVSSGIAWWTDKHVKFRNPGGHAPNLTAAFQGTVKPVNWPRPVYQLDSAPDNNGFINEDFIVWMRTAALPTFRKLHRIINRTSSSAPTLPRGNYSLRVAYNYPVRGFEGRKRMILTTVSWMGGKNPFLGVAYMTVGSICFFLGVVLVVVHHRCGGRSGSADISR